MRTLVGFAREIDLQYFEILLNLFALGDRQKGESDPFHEPRKEKGFLNSRYCLDSNPQNLCHFRKDIFVAKTIPRRCYRFKVTTTRKFVVRLSLR